MFGWIDAMKVRRNGNCSGVAHCRIDRLPEGRAPWKPQPQPKLLLGEAVVEGKLRRIGAFRSLMIALGNKPQTVSREIRARTLIEPPQSALCSSKT